MNSRGFTLLEVMVATLIMAIAITGLLSGISSSLRNAASLTDRDRAALLAKQKMQELLTRPQLPEGLVLEGGWDPQETSGLQAGWRTRIERFETLPNPAPGSSSLNRIVLQIWWLQAGKQKTYELESFRRSSIPILVGPR